VPQNIEGDVFLNTAYIIMLSYSVVTVLWLLRQWQINVLKVHF